MRCYVMNIIDTIDSTIAILCDFALQSYAFFPRLSSLVFIVGVDMVFLTKLVEESFGYSE